jgi:hypothetical protein
MEPRVFKTAWFAKAAKKAGIADSELLRAFQEIIVGQAVDLGGGVFKKRISKNNYRTIVLSRSGRYCVFEYLFAKRDRANIRSDELGGFRALSAIYAGLSDQQLERLLQTNAWVEVCHDREA